MVQTVCVGSCCRAWASSRRAPPTSIFLSSRARLLVDGLSIRPDSFFEALLSVSDSGILALNAPQYIRCYELSGSPLGLPLPVDFPRIEVTVAHVTVRGTLANVLRNISLHLSTRSESINLKTERMFRLAIRGLGSDPDDPREIWFPGEPFR